MLDERSKHLRRLVLRALRAKGGGHMASAFSLIEIMRALYDDIKQPDDKIILSKGHGALAQFALLADKNIIPVDEMDRFCKKDGILGGHPAPHVPGVLCHTGALGHGLSIGIGFALAARIRKQKHRIFVIVGDGECNEGSVWEAAMSACKHDLSNLVVIVDRNRIQSAGFTKDVQPMESLREKFRAFGFACYECNGHDLDALKSELAQSYPGKPFCLIANTIKGKGISFAENNPQYHHRNFSALEFKAMEGELA